LGHLAGKDCSRKQIREHARKTYVPLEILMHWKNAYQKHGIGGLLPNWAELSQKDIKLVLERQEWLGELADAGDVSIEDIEQRAQQLGWKYPQRLQDWLKRYRSGGLWGLTSASNPKKIRRQEIRQNRKPPRDEGVLTEDDWKLIDQRTALIGEKLLEDIRTGEAVADKAVRARAQEVGIATSTLWDYIKRYREFGLKGLARQQRADKGNRHNDPWLERAIRAVRLNGDGLSVRAVWERVCEIADELGKERPTQSTTRRVVESIPKPARLLADGRLNQFRNSYRFSGWINYNGIVLQIDHTQVDVLVEDLRKKSSRRKSKLVRPWLTIATACSSRLIVAAIFSYDQPDQHTVAAVIRDALTDHNGLPGGLCDEIWVDKGKDLLSKHVKRLTQELGILLWPVHCPEHKPIIERLFGTLNTRLWSTIRGYVSSNTKDRHPNAEKRANLTIYDVEERFWAFIKRYHNEVHSELGVTPLEHWAEHFYTEPVDLERLGILLQRGESRVVQKSCIEFEGREYWHADLSTIVGAHVFVRCAPLYEPPDEIDVYHDGHYHCTAFAKDSEQAEHVTRTEMAEAIRNQRTHYGAQIKAARDDHAALQRELADIQKSELGSASQGPDIPSGQDTADHTPSATRHPDKGEPSSPSRSSSQDSAEQQEESIFRIAARNRRQNQS
jgi:putative transposase